MNKKHDKDKVLQTGLELFWSNGYSNVGVDELCNKTGMTKGAFYNAFKSKEQFLLLALESYGDATVINHTAALKAQDGERAILSLYRLYEGMLKHQKNSNYAGCLVNNMMSELGVINETVSKATAVEFERFISVIEPVVKQAQTEGDFNDMTDARSLAVLIHSTFFGVLTRIKGSRDYREGTDTMQLLIKSLSTTNQIKE